MAAPPPRAPDSLHPLSRELLETLAGHDAAAEIVIGGGVALGHYLDYRTTVDLDAWWQTSPREDVLALLEGAMQAIASRHGLAYRRRSWGDTESLELMKGGLKHYSFQIARRDVFLDDPLPSPWHPVRIETLRDNVASKMLALVQRGAPRDFLDIFQVCTRDVTSIAECWAAFAGKATGMPIDEAKRKIVARLAMLEATRPLESIEPAEAREQAGRLRKWFYGTFAAAAP